MNKTEIKQFEIEQKDFGTEIALNNFLVMKMTKILYDELGVVDMKFKYKKDL
jgi:hypothetical protein